MQTAGNREVIFSSTLIVADKEEAMVEFDSHDEHFRIIFIFDPSAEGAREIRWVADAANTLRVTVAKWSNPLGTTLPMPIRIGTAGNQTLSFQIVHWKIAELINRADVQFLLGEA